MNTQPKIVTIGGGTGEPTILRSLILAGINDITAICPATDSGGRSGIMRYDYQGLPAIGDWYNCLKALIRPQDLDRKNVKAFFEFAEHHHGAYRKNGYTLMYLVLSRHHGDYNATQDWLEDVLDIKLQGRVMPSTTSLPELCFSTESGTTYRGEHELDPHQMSSDMVKKIWLEPAVKANPQTIEAIKQAEEIILCPGSLYGSLITNFLPHGIGEVLSQTSARITLVTNLFSDRNQTHNFTLKNYFETISQYAPFRKRPFDHVIVPQTTREEFEQQYPRISSRYNLEYSHFLDYYDQLEYLPSDITVQREDVFTISPAEHVRHDPAKLATIWQKLFNHA